MLSFTPAPDRAQPPVATYTRCPVSWHDHLDAVPQGFSMFLAHEFFDALPVHKLVKVEEEWREVLVDVNPKGAQSTEVAGNQKGEDTPLPFRYVLSRTATPASKIYTKVCGEELSEGAKLFLFSLLSYCVSLLQERSISQECWTFSLNSN